MEIHAGPEVVERPAIDYVGMRAPVPFRGMVSRADAMTRDLLQWCAGNEVLATGPSFLRLHVIDMSGTMDIAVGVPTDLSLLLEPAGPPVISDTLPAGHYATMTYNNHSVRANRHLLEWCADNGHDLDRKDVPEGDWFACRYEALLSDPQKEPRKNLRHVQLNFKLAGA